MTQLSTADRGFDLRHHLRAATAAEGCDLDRLGAEFHVREAEAPADDPAVSKQLLDLMRMRRRADIEVLRPPIEQQIANAAADQIRDVIVFVQPIENLEGVGIDVATRDRDARSRNDGRLHHRRRL